MQPAPGFMIPQTDPHTIATKTFSDYPQVTTLFTSVLFVLFRLRR